MTGMAIFFGWQIVAPSKTTGLIAGGQIRTARGTVGQRLDQVFCRKWVVGVVVSEWTARLNGPLDNDLIGSTMVRNPSSKP